MGFIVNDRRGKSNVANEACRVCGSPEVHTREYGKPSMKCIQYLRENISALKNTISEMEDIIEDLRENVRRYDEEE